MIIIISYDENFFSNSGENVLERHILYHNLSKELYKSELYIIILTKYKSINENYPFIKNISGTNFISRNLNLYIYIYKNRNKINVITSQKFGLSATPIIIFTKLFNIRYYLQVHTYFISRKFFLSGFYNLTNTIFGLFNIMLSDKVRVVSNGLKEFINNFYFNKDVHVIPVPTISGSNLVDKYKEYDLIYIGRLSSEKNPCLFLDIVKSGKYKSLLIGSGKLKQDILSKIDYKFTDYIEFVNEREIPIYLSKARLLVITSDFEGLSRVGIQAISVGVPVVSTDCKGVNDYIIDGENGFIIKNYQVSCFISKINRLLYDVDLYNKFAIKCLDYGKKYNYASIVNEYINFLND